MELLHHSISSFKQKHRFNVLVSHVANKLKKKKCKKNAKRKMKKKQKKGKF